jgi:hypothetical protein
VVPPQLRLPCIRRVCNGRDPQDCCKCLFRIIKCRFSIICHPFCRLCQGHFDTVPILGDRIRQSRASHWVMPHIELLVSRSLAGGDELAGKAAVVDAPVGSGHVVMFGIRPLWRWKSQGVLPWRRMRSPIGTIWGLGKPINRRAKGTERPSSIISFFSQESFRIRRDQLPLKISGRELARSCGLA